MVVDGDSVFFPEGVNVGEEGRDVMGRGRAAAGGGGGGVGDLALPAGGDGGGGDLALAAGGGFADCGGVLGSAGSA